MSVALSACLSRCLLVSATLRQCIQRRRIVLTLSSVPTLCKLKECRKKKNFPHVSCRVFSFDQSWVQWPFPPNVPWDGLPFLYCTYTSCSLSTSVCSSSFFDCVQTLFLPFSLRPHRACLVAGCLPTHSALLNSPCLLSVASEFPDGRTAGQTKRAPDLSSSAFFSSQITKQKLHPTRH